MCGTSVVMHRFEFDSSLGGIWLQVARHVFLLLFFPCPFVAITINTRSMWGLLFYLSIFVVVVVVCVCVYTLFSLLASFFLCYSYIFFDIYSGDR